MKNIFFIICLFLNLQTNAQTKSTRIVEKWKPVVEKNLLNLGLKNFNSVYIRAFKLDEEMEVWVGDGEKFELYKTYKICLVSGIPGRKNIQDDKQVPEGIYHIIEYNQASVYHLSLKINYPNKSDYMYSDSTRPGDEIFIHGGCVSVGCIPITNEMIEEVWTICKLSKDKFIDVHIFSGRFNLYRNIRKLDTFVYTIDDYRFQEQMKEVFFYFENNRKIPLIKIDNKGRYIIN